jgi:hypothetical protein
MEMTWTYNRGAKEQHVFVFLDTVSGFCWMNDASSKLHILGDISCLGHQ